jgi:hypothetical protein
MGPSVPTYDRSIAARYAAKRRTYLRDRPETVRSGRSRRGEVPTYPSQMAWVEPLEVAGWRLVTGDLRSEDLPELGTDALVRGLDSPALRLLAGQSPADVRDSRDLFARALVELGIDLPEYDAAVWSLVRLTARDIVDGTVTPATGANEIWRRGYHRVAERGDLRIFVGLASRLDDHPEDRTAIELDILAGAKELLARPVPRRWIKLMAHVGCSPLTWTGGHEDVEVDPADLPLRPGLVAHVRGWSAEHSALFDRWPDQGGFASEGHAEDFVGRGRELVDRLQMELGDRYHVKYVPEPIRPPGVKLVTPRY